MTAGIHLIEGDGARFMPDSPITREEMAALAVRTYRISTGVIPQNGDIDTFEDKENISIWVVSSVKAARGLGIMKGSSDTRFEPVQFAGRAQAAAIISRLFKKM